MINFVEHTYAAASKDDQPYYLVGDIGGTNSNFGIGQIGSTAGTLMRSLHVKTSTVNDFTALVAYLLRYVQEHYGITVKHACFAVAAAIMPPARRAVLTNAQLTVDADELLRIAGLTSITLVNDFEVIGYGIDLIAPENRVQVQKGKVDQHGNRALLGAGTGLGASILHWVPALGRYVSVPSEAGHMDFAAQNKLDIDLVTYVQQQHATIAPVSWEEIIAGRGVGMLYGFLGATRTYASQDAMLAASNGPHPDEIFASRVRDQRAKDTCTLYTEYYARCAKNWALATVALGGLYIVGGIAAHNADLFKDARFLQLFGASDKHAQLLRDIPVWVITDYNVSLYGALEYMRVELM